MTKFKLLGLAGAAGVGKDTFFKIAQQIAAEEFNIELVRVSLGDKIKERLRDFIWNEFRFFSFTTIPEEKAIIRSIIVTYVEAMRSVWGENVFLKMVDDEVIQLISQKKVPVFTDIRYPTEFNWVKCNGGQIVYIDRIIQKNPLKIVPPANEAEARNNPILLKDRDYYFQWESCPDIDKLKEKYRPKFEEILKNSYFI